MPSPWPQTPPTAAHRAAYADAVRRSYWLDSLPERTPHPPLETVIDADLCIVGGGYTGLWAALYAKQLDPGRDVVLLEATRCGGGASGRNGGFVESSLTHGTSNGLTRFPKEIDQIERLGLENFEALARDVEVLGIDAELERTGDLVVALEPHQLADLPEEAELMRRFGYETELLDARRTRNQVDSPLFLGALWTRTGSALVHPGKLGDGLRAAAARAGVRIHEHSPARELHPAGNGVSVGTDAGVVNARGALLATSAYPPLLGTIRRHIAPVYDYALVTEPLDSDRRAAVGWRGRQGLSDMGNQFHYSRLTEDGRILRSTSSRPSRRSKAFASPTAGAARSTRAAVFRCSSGGRCAAGFPTRSATPAWASRRAGSEAVWRSTCSTDARTIRPSSSWCAGAHSPSHSSRCALR